MRGILNKYCPAHVLILHELAYKNKIDYLLYQLRDLDGKHDMCTQKNHTLLFVTPLFYS